MSRRPGRPPLDPTDPTINVNLKLPSRDYDDALRPRARRAAQPLGIYPPATAPADAGEISNAKIGRRPARSLQSPVTLDRAYAPLVVKTVDAPRRHHQGHRVDADARSIAATSSNRSARRFRTRIPLLYQHDKERPVGLATLTATADGIRFEATLPEIATPGLARDRHQEVWDLIGAGLIRAVSIGFRPLADGVKRLKGGAAHFLKTEICELSLVTIPANVEATLQVIKSLDAPHLAASGRNPPDIAGSIVARLQPMAKQTTTEQITQWENKRAAHTARMSDLMAQAGDAGTTLEPDQVDEYDGLDAEVKSIDAHLVRLRALEKTQLASATPRHDREGARDLHRPQRRHRAAERAARHGVRPRRVRETRLQRQPARGRRIRQALG